MQCIQHMYCTAVIWFVVCAECSKNSDVLLGRGSPTQQTARQRPAVRGNCSEPSAHQLLCSIRAWPVQTTREQSHKSAQLGSSSLIKCSIVEVSPVVSSETFLLSSSTSPPRGIEVSVKVCFALCPGLKTEVSFYKVLLGCFYKWLWPAAFWLTPWLGDLVPLEKGGRCLLAADYIQLAQGIWLTDAVFQFQQCSRCVNGQHFTCLFLYMHM